MVRFYERILVRFRKDNLFSEKYQRLSAELIHCAFKKIRVYWTTLFFARFLSIFFSSGFFLAVFLSAFLCDFLSEFFPDFLSDYLPNSLFNFLSDFFVQFHVGFLSGSPVLCLVLCLVLRLEIFQVEIRVPLSIFQMDSPDPGNSGQYLSCHLEF